MVHKCKRSWETGSVTSRNSAARNSYRGIVLETEKGVEGGREEEKGPARLSAEAQLSCMSTQKIETPADV